MQTKCNWVEKYTQPASLTYSSYLASNRVSCDFVHTAPGYNRHSPVTAPWPEQLPPFNPQDQPCSHFPDDIIPAGAKSLFGGVSPILCCFSPFLAQEPIQAMFASPTREQGPPAWATEEPHATLITAGDAQAIETLGEGQSPPFGGKMSCTQTRTRFIANENPQHSLGRTLWLVLLFSMRRPLPSTGVFLARGPGLEAPRGFLL